MKVFGNRSRNGHDERKDTKTKRQSRTITSAIISFKKYNKERYDNDPRKELYKRKKCKEIGMTIEQWNDYLEQSTTASTQLTEDMTPEDSYKNTKKNTIMTKINYTRIYAQLLSYFLFSKNEL
jgi:hypothetical protein